MKLQARSLSFSYIKSVPVLQNISFALEEGELLSVLGPNGAGKSTLFRCILGLVTGYTGEILLNEIDLHTLSPGARARAMAYIPQLHTPVFGYTALDTVLMGLSRFISPLSQPGRSQRDKAMEALALLGLEPLAQRNFTRLSGGEQQLVLIARAIAQDASILIMDEPTASLDYGNQYLVLEQVKQLSQRGYSVLLSTHNPQHALTFADRLLALEGNRVAALGPCRQAMTPALLERLYHMEARIVETEQGPVLLPLRRKETP